MKIVLPVGIDVDPAVTDHYLQQCYDLVSATLTQDCASLSTTHWLWLLRRVPDHFFEKRETSARGAGFYRNLAEIISAIGGAPASNVPPLKGDYPQDARTIGSLLRLIAGVKILANIEWLIRSNGRGVRLVFEGGELPITRETAGDKSAWDLYWHRIGESGGRFLARGGSEFGLEVFDETVTGALATVGRVASQVVRTEGVRSSERVTSSRVLKSYHPQLFSLAKMTYLLRDMSGISSWPRHDFWTLLLTLRLAALIFWDFQPPWSQLLQFGYVSVDYDHVLELFAGKWHEAVEDLGRQFPMAVFPQNPEALCQELAAQRPVIRPILPLPVLRIDHNLAIFDIAAGTFALEAGADFTADQGVPANLRASHFERVIQGVIDETTWRPLDRLRELRGRTLRIGGHAITDVDAIGCRDGKLLLVSGKSTVYTSEHDLGRYNALRNLSSTVEAASAAAVKVREILRRTPKGDNFDFSGHSTLDVVVCTPFVVYVRNGIATELIVAGLHRAVSLRELRRFLRNT